MQRDVLHIGSREVWGGAVPFGLSHSDLNQHLLVLGKSGTGKSTLLKSLALQLVDAGEGVGLIDPHGDLAEEILDYIPPGRIEDTLYFNPSDREHPIGLNLLAHVEQQRRELIAAGFVASLRSLWRDFFGPRMEYIIYNAALALLDCENVTILGLHRMLTDDRYLSWVLRQAKDPAVHRFFEQEFRQWDKSFRHEAVASILNKTGQIILAPVVRNVVGQVKRKFDPRFMMDHRRVMIANLSKGTLGDDKASLLGSLLVNGFAHAAMSRANIVASDRVPFTLIVDEFTTLGSDVFASILSEARKYGLRLVVATQFLDLVDERVLPALIGNIGSILSFRVGNVDANILEREFGDSYSAHTFSSRPNFEVAAKLLERGEHHEPFLGKVEPFVNRPFGTRDRVIARSREKYSTSRTVVESRIERWFANGGQSPGRRRGGLQRKR